MSCLIFKYLKSISFHITRVINYPELSQASCVCLPSVEELGTHAEGFDWMSRLRAAAEMRVNWLGSSSALWNEWRNSYAIQLGSCSDRGTVRGDSCHLVETKLCHIEKLLSNSIRLKRARFLCVCTISEFEQRANMRKVVFVQLAAKGDFQQIVPYLSLMSEQESKSA